MSASPTGPFWKPCDRNIVPRPFSLSLPLSVCLSVFPSLLWLRLVPAKDSHLLVVRLQQGQTRHNLGDEVIILQEYKGRVKWRGWGRGRERRVETVHWFGQQKESSWCWWTESGSAGGEWKPHGQITPDLSPLTSVDLIGFISSQCVGSHSCSCYMSELAGWSPPAQICKTSVFDGCWSNEASICTKQI